MAHALFGAVNTAAALHGLHHGVLEFDPVLPAPGAVTEAQQLSLLTVTLGFQQALIGPLGLCRTLAGLLTGQSAKHQ